MKKKLIAVVLSASGLLVAPSLLADNAKTMNDEQNKVLNTIIQMGQSYNSGDIDAVMKSYVPAPVVVFEPSKPVKGAAAVKAKFEESLAINPQFVYGEHEVIISDGIALHLTPWTMTGKTPDGKPIAQNGFSIAVLKKQKDGKWLMVIDDPHGQMLLSEQTNKKVSAMSSESESLLK
ncbi:MAG: DUF4440 domain-containing protein [Methylococcaceae bacterium]|jgi:ketosteroid isomerase-like protein